MKTLRRWELDAKRVALIKIASDSRVGSTDYVDDQVWQPRFGSGDTAAIVLQTQYGGRADAVSLVPVWTVDNHTIYQDQTYFQRPVVTHFLPNYMRLEAAVTEQLSFSMQIWAFDSHTLAGTVNIHNSGNKPIAGQLELYADVKIAGEVQPTDLLPLPQGLQALFLGTVGNLEPVLIMEHGRSLGNTDRIGRRFTIQPNKEISLRWINVSLPNVRQSLSLANQWFKKNWQAYVKNIHNAAAAIPIIQTGNSDWDWLISASYNRLIQAFINPAGDFPHGTIVARRLPDQGFSAKADGSDYPRSWNGLEPTLSYLVLPVMAGISPKIAEGILRNYLAIQQADGWIDNRPGPAGQRQKLLCLPILARTAWQVFQQTEDDAFLSSVFPALLSCLERWMERDMDADRDGFPEWQHEHQTGYTSIPTFGSERSWAQGANIRTIESPDLLAYLLAEATTLYHMAQHLEKKTTLQPLDDVIARLTKHLEALWQNDHFVYRDRDTHVTTGGTTLLKDGVGDEVHEINQSLLIPNRLIIHIVGGVNHVPRIRLHIEGEDTNGTKIKEVLETKAFQWQQRQGVATSEYIYSKIDSVRCDGLSRVYRINMKTMDTTGLDINCLLPLWTGHLPDVQNEALVRLATSKEHFYRPTGLTMVSSKDRHYDPSNAEGSGGVWPFWMTLICEGLVMAGAEKQAADTLKSLLDHQVETTLNKGQFGQFYHSERAEALGEKDHLAGIVPLHLLTELTGIRIVNSGKVWVGGAFGWDRAITIRQYGVAVRRTRNSIKVTFASGYSTELPGDARWQPIIDPNPQKTATYEKVQTPDSRPTPPPRPIRINIDIGD